ncbi:hypothetical protein VZT92_026747 [Zoarces viviparus]|uniref:Gypsy retrotransposon integrase-like protein 1 n=1 Tax=Zoarces viviparus TaxID=48416 RepID=A0AAW1DRC3_ZOAVI
MDPADDATAWAWLETIEEGMRRTQTMVATNTAEVRQDLANQNQVLVTLIDQVRQLRAATAPANGAASPQLALVPSRVDPAASTAVSEPRVGEPERYAGDPEGCNTFLTNCSIMFALQPRTFASEDARVAFTINHLTGRARLWGTAEWDRRTPACVSFQSFSAELRKVFGAVSGGPDVTGGLMRLQQGHRSVTDYAIEFRTQARLSSWGMDAQCDAYLLGLADYIKHELISTELPTSLDRLIETTSRVDRHIQVRRLARRRGQPHQGQTYCFPRATALDYAPTQRSSGERTHASGTYWALHGGMGAPQTGRPLHVLWSGRSLRLQLPIKSPGSPVRKAVLVSRADSRSSACPRPLFHAQLLLTGGAHTISTFLDSGADASFMDEDLVTQLGIDLLIPSFWDSPGCVDIIHTSTGLQVLFGQACHLVCLKQAAVPQSVALSKSTPDLTGVPAEYWDFREVFNKSKALSLPPHRPYDCAIDLHPGTFPPKGRLYSLSAPERGAMDKYINDSLASGIIRPSSSPAGAGFFFVEKKDKTLRPCIDYRGLNEITVKNRYPLPLIATAFELLQGATIFSKLDLRNAYHLVRIREGDEWKTAFNTPKGHYEYLVMPFGLTNAPAIFQALVNDVLRDMLDRHVFVYLDDILIFSKNREEHVHHVQSVLQRLLENSLFVKAEKCEFHVPTVSFLGYIVSQGSIQMDPAKVAAVTAWPVPSSRKQLQSFLGFANFYRRFIRNYSAVASPLTALTSSKTPFRWTSAAEETFQNLKLRFTSAPILRVPDPDRQFVVEVDASDIGVGGVLSQRSATDQNLHPCAFFSRRLSPDERNYDIGNRELLAVKLALERHWLEGTKLPFLVWTDHKNLEYIRTAKRLNYRQARWSLFFTRFHFSLSYRPGSRNVKPDALSRQFQGEEGPTSDSSSILPASCQVGVLTWEIERSVRSATRGQAVPSACPPNRLFVPQALRSNVLQWAHASPLTCHPGIQRTQDVLRQRFWWASLNEDTREFVNACPVCNQHKPSRLAPAGLLRPLPVPHISLDFVTGLPLSEGHTVILTVVDRFSKLAHFIPLPKLPSAKETAELICLHIFRLHGIPIDIVSDRGPQFTSIFWREFCTMLGATVSLSSGFHPQSNGQTERKNQEMETALRCMVSRNPATPVPGIGKGGFLSVCPNIQPPLPPDLGKGPRNPASVCGPCCYSGKSTPHSSPQLPGGSEGVVGNQGSTFAGGVQEAGPTVHRAVRD